ncbi:MAG: iron complex outermembrane receptor protein, partial [Halieaceae bacterium]
SLLEVQPRDFSPSQPRGVHYDYEVDAKTWAGFGQLSWNLSPTLTLDAGARYESTQYNYETKVTPGSACAASVSNCRFFRPADSTDDFSDWSLNAGLGYQYHPDHKAYIRLANGFRAPQATEMYRLQAGQIQADLDSEQLRSLEFGISGTIGSLLYRLDAWSMRKSDVIFQNSNRQNLSGARTSHHGVDGNFEYQINPQVKASLVYSNAMHRYDSTATLLGTRLELKGNIIDTAPRHIGSARLHWQPSAKTRFELEWAYLGSYFTDPDNLHSYPGHDLVNIRANLDWSKRLSVGARVLNILNEDYAERADFGFGNERYFVGEPSSVFLDIQYNW